MPRTVLPVRAAALRLSPSVRSAVARLEKALRHVEHPPRVPVYLGLARIADQAEVDVARSLRGAWTHALDGLELADAYQRGDVEPVVQAVAERVRQRVQAAGEVSFLRARVRAGEFVSGTRRPAIEKRVLRRLLLGSIDWFLLNPKMVTAARTQATRLGEVEHDTTVEAIRQAVVDGLAEGLPYDEAATLIEGSIGLNARQQRALARLAGVLRARGVEGDDLADAVVAYADRARAYRAELIARTEGQQASNGGAFATYQEGRSQGLLAADLVKEWIASNDACPICAPANGQQRRLDESFVLDGGRIVVAHPPAHPNCRCKFGMAEP